MTKIYAIVSPAFTMSGDGFADIAYLAVAPFHKLFYERVCGYSLGHNAHFYDTIQEAKSRFERVIASDAASISRRVTQSAIIELEFDQGQIIGFNKIYIVDDITQLIKSKKDARFFKVIDVPVWKELTIGSADISANALAEINRQYQTKDGQHLSSAMTN
ncbi:hypothetical protein [Legionella sp. 227]|uniref:hypothetical protein n=1 Tax=Legionella sp. 227 TaxID=3367288 RepID=UPI00370DB784